MARPWALARPKTFRVGQARHQVEEVPGQALERPHAGAAVRSLVVRPTSAMNTGIRGTVTAMRAAEIQSAPATTAMMVTGTMTARKSCGR